MDFLRERIKDFLLIRFRRKDATQPTREVQQGIPHPARDLEPVFLYLLNLDQFARNLLELDLPPANPSAARLCGRRVEAEGSDRSGALYPGSDAAGQDVQHLLFRS